MDEQQQQGNSDGNGMKNSSLLRMSNSGPDGGSVIGSSRKQGISFGRGTFNKPSISTKAVPDILTPSQRFPIPFKYKKGKGIGSQKPSLASPVASTNIQFGSLARDMNGESSEMNGESNAPVAEPSGYSDPLPASSISTEIPPSVASQEDLPPATSMETEGPSDVASGPWMMCEEDFPALGAVPVNTQRGRGVQRRWAN